ncbi:hypothetical protein [Halogeometricum borinquense]|uniref:hypothetical protein n=1 Tax=Halogeometricum borinquense TaxID=60847 RepID=UPI003425D477
MATTQTAAKARVEDASSAEETFELPGDLPGENDMTRALFGVYDDAEALEVLVEGSIIYLMPWAARDGGVAAFEQDLETFRPSPREFTGDEVRRLLEAHIPRSTSLLATPAWLLTERGDGPKVSWHARCRWNERIEQVADPGPNIREAYRRGLSVGVDYGHGRYYPPEDVVLCAVHDHGEPIVTTVYQPDDVRDLGADHLTECAQCSEPYDPGNQQNCTCCGGPVCPWCRETVA